ncbi:MAG: phosphoribosylanthranilate isomerase [Pseudomonadota bacterium]
MPRDLQIKICGLTAAQDIDAAAAAGAHYVGFVFFEKSPRYVAPATAATLAQKVPANIRKVGLVVDPSDQFLAELMGQVPLDMVQLHGEETPHRVEAVKSISGRPVMKAVGVSGASDVARLKAYFGVADQILVDAKPPEGSDLPGGNGLTFDWQLIARRDWPIPWMLAGGLTAANVAQAVQLTGAPQVDVSSAVESAPGVKDPARIATFCAAALSE